MASRLLILALFWRVFAPAQAHARPQPPKLVVEQAEIDLGEARSGTVLSHTFRLENHGERLLQIRNIRTSCGCTASEISTREIPAGGHATLTATLDLTGRAGPQAEQIRLQTNDPETPNRVLSLKALAIPRVNVTPRTLNFQQISADAPPSGRILIEATTDAPLQITDIRTAHARVETALTEVEPGQTYHLDIRPVETGGTGHFTERIEILTDDPEQPSIPALVMWQIAEAVSVAPRQLNLMLSDPPQPVTRFLMIRGQTDLDPPMEVTSVTWEGREVEMKIGAAGSFGTRVEFSITPEPGMNGEQIRIRTNVPGFENLSLPVRVLTP
ncbi:MAG: DUF1573 domain-containing protein [Verrucomicrobia bacterium]|nr:DUF1573 domain-containing protein [Verrucomicrobiota bacterium]MCH8528940.1 DUF1573 domain-containing protein [Kiritimatiellia bacterium]